MRLTRLPTFAVAAMAALLCAASAVAEDSAKKACFADAKRLCPAEVKAMSRKRAEACLYQKIAQTTPHCHDTILLIHAQRTAVRTLRPSGR